MKQPDFFKRANKVLEAEAGKQGGTPTPAQPAAPAQPAQPAEKPTPNINQPDKPAASSGAAAGTVNPPAPATGPEAQESPEQIAMRILQERGIKVNNLDELASRFNNQPLTEEDKKKLEQQREQALLSRFIESGKGTMDDFYSIRSLKDVADVDLVKADFINYAQEVDPELSVEEAEELFAKRYFVGADGEYSDREVKIGQDRINKAAAAIRQRKASPISEIEAELQQAEASVSQRQQWESQVEQYAATMPKSIEIALGTMGDAQTDLGNFTYQLSDEEQKDLVNALKDPSFLLKEISNEEGKTDLGKLANLLQWKMIAQRAIKASAYENYSKGIEKVSGRLNNFPDLRNMGGHSAGEGTAEVEQGKAQIRQDSRSILGRRTHRKTIGS